ncbi:hypothetical protein AWN76_014450 [Rhodothermaceae bacterium RA]|nr:hypothetical protein AWN76_014450 [Rhodothermaceae bacterium RA]
MPRRALLLVLLLPGLMPFGLMPPATWGHREHVSEAVLVVAPDGLRGRIRFFAHDLEEALRQAHGDPALRLAVSAEVDGRFAAYLAPRFVLRQEGTPLAVRIVASGEDTFGHHRLWWYELAYDGYRPGAVLELRNTLLFDRFADQQNRVVLRRPDAAERVFVFTPTADRFILTP